MILKSLQNTLQFNSQITSFCIVSYIYTVFVISKNVVNTDFTLMYKMKILRHIDKNRKNDQDISSINYAFNQFIWVYE